MKNREEMLDFLEGDICISCGANSYKHLCRASIDREPHYMQNIKCACCYNCECMTDDTGRRWSYRHEYESSKTHS